MTGTPSVSVVLPVFRNRAELADLHQRLQAALAGFSSVQIIYVNDACPDGSLGELTRIARGDPRVLIITFDENRGQHQALCAGLMEAIGDVVVTMDADLQDPPEAIPSLVAALADGCGAAYAGRRGRYESSSRLATSWMFKRIIAFISGMPADAGAFMAMTQPVARRAAALARHRPYLTAVVAQVGRPVRSIPVERSVRRQGQSAYSSAMRAGLGARAIVQALKWRATGLPR